MTIREAVDRIDDVLVNQYSDEEKIAWLSVIDGNIYNELLATHEGAPTAQHPYNHKIKGIQDTQLYAPSPYDELYIYWLESMIFYRNGEMERYINAQRRFNTVLSDYYTYYNRTVKPIGRNFRGY